MKLEAFEGSRVKSGESIRIGYGGTERGLWCLRDTDNIHALKGAVVIEIDGKLLSECQKCNAFVPVATSVNTLALFGVMSDRAHLDVAGERRASVEGRDTSAGEGQ